MNVYLVPFLFSPLVCGALVWAFVRFVRGARRRGKALGPLAVMTGNGLVFLLFSSVVVGAGESYFRFVYDETDSFGYTRASKRWFDHYWKVNARGFRDDIE